MSDPDAPSRDVPKASEWMHWLVINIPENSTTLGDVKWYFLKNLIENFAFKSLF